TAVFGPGRCAEVQAFGYRLRAADQLQLARFLADAASGKRLSSLEGKASRGWGEVVERNQSSRPGVSRVPRLPSLTPEGQPSRRPTFLSVFDGDNLLDLARHGIESSATD